MGWTISWEEFLSYVDEIIVLSDEIGDGWTWQGDRDIPGGAYVMLKIKQHLPEGISHRDKNKEELLEDRVVSAEEFSAELGSHGNECTWEYHILYSLSYATPLIYFNAYSQDGRLLPLEILWTGLHSGSAESLQHLRGEALSQQEHPILRRPFFQLHPCKTAEFLNIHQGHSLNPVVTWLSSVGPAIALNLNNAYSQLVTPMSGKNAIVDEED